MTISIDLVGTYYEYKEFFDTMAVVMQAAGHRVGIISGERAKDPYTGANNVDRFMRELGFKPDFFHIWGENETIVNGDSWKAQKMIDEGVAMHFDDDAPALKKFTDLWVMKSMNSAEPKKF
jgi:hypothetical protein